MYALIVIYVMANKPYSDAALAFSTLAQCQTWEVSAEAATLRLHPELTPDQVYSTCVKLSSVLPNGTIIPHRMAPGEIK